MLNCILETVPALTGEEEEWIAPTVLACLASVYLGFSLFLVLQYGVGHTAPAKMTQAPGHSHIVCGGGWGEAGGCSFYCPVF